MPRLPQEIRALEHFRLVFAQKEKLKIYHNARRAMQPFFQGFASAWKFTQNGEGHVWVDDVRLVALITALEDMMLVLLDDPFRDSYRDLSEQTASRLVRGHGAIQTIAWAELSLRKLAILCVTAASKRFQKSLRLVQWQDEIELAKAEFEAALTAWTQLTRT